MIKRIGCLSLLLVMSACNDNDSYERGLFLDSAVAGVKYTTAGRQDMTDADGGFEYVAGQEYEVIFRIGSVELGFAKAAPILLPLDLHRAASDSQAGDFGLNVARFLQSIDNDANPENGIQITEVMHDLATNRSINFRQSAENFADDGDVQILIADLSATRPVGAGALVDRPSAAAHMTDTVNSVLADISDDLLNMTGNASCTSDAQCSTVAVGYRSCGGPAWFLPYSTSETDGIELERVAAEHRRHSRSLVGLLGLISTCDALSSPNPMCVAGQCTAVNRYPSPL